MKTLPALSISFLLAVAVVALFLLGVMLLDSQPELIGLLAFAAGTALYGLVKAYGWLRRRPG